MKFFIVFLLLFSFHSSAATCYAVSDWGSLTPTNETIDNCSGFLFIGTSEYSELMDKNAVDMTAILNTLVELFEFSTEDFLLFNSICLIGFICGHSLGRVNRLLGKT
ncbi:MAG: hypothetical protein OCD00_02015 [Colwellia sp.]